MKSVLISVRPQWVEKIASRECTILVRKTKPKLETPFKCYIYCVNGTQLLDIRKERIYLDTNKSFLLTNGKSNKVICSTPPQVNRKIIGEFICDRVTGYYPYGLRGFELSKETLTAMCLSNKDLNKYGKLDRVYGWHISELEIYDEPKNLSDFGQKCKYAKYQDDEWYGGWFCYGNESIECDWQDCPKCSGENEEYEDFAYCMCMGKKPLTRPPQSWCYVEVGE